MISRKILVTALFILQSISVFSRQLAFTQNPGCKTDCATPWLTYGMSSDHTGNSSQTGNTMHYMWGCSDVPVFLVASSSVETKVDVDWIKFQAGEPGSITFTPSPNDVFGVSFQQLILFNDVDDDGKLDSKDESYSFPLENFEWTYVLPKNFSTHTLTTYFETRTYKNTPLNDTRIAINITAYAEEGREDNVPHLSFNPKSAQVAVLLDNLVVDFRNLSDNSAGQQLLSVLLNDGVKHHHHSRSTISGFKNPRWALDMIVVSDDNLNQNRSDDFLYEARTSLDDEYAPGVFTLTNIMTNSANKRESNVGGYMQYRPVCYLTPEFDINFSTTPNFNESLPPLDDDHYRMMNNSLMSAVFGESVKNLAGFQSIVAFGQPKDEFYTSFNYTLWTFSIGIGSPPEEFFSTLVIVAILVGVGIPLLLLTLSGVFFGVKKILRRRKRDELLIEENEEES